MKNIKPFTFRRSRGIVWVCDIANSSNYLNSNKSAADIESFIPRLYYVSKLIVDSYGGIFVKWTGDGFLAFFECELDRQKLDIAKLVFEAAGRLSFLANITQFGLIHENKFEIRHGITYEKDGLFMDLKSENQTLSTDVIGRDIVLAFRISGIQTNYPSIVTMQELVDVNDHIFIKWTPKKDQKKSIFKGEEYGTHSVMIFAEDESSSKQKSFLNYLKQVEIKTMNPRTIFAEKMYNGPDWCKEIIKSEIKIFADVFANIIKSIIGTVKKNK